MTVSTLGILAHVTPALIKNAFRNYVRFWITLGDGSKRLSANEFYYNQVFLMIKELADYLTHETAEDVQKLTDTQLPAPPWASSRKVMIPMSTCSDAAQYLIEYFGPQSLQEVVGGARWWQMRTLEGVPGEWISQYTDYHTVVRASEGKNTSLSTSMAKHMTRNTQNRNPRHEQPNQPYEQPNSEAGRYADTDEERTRLTRVMLYFHGGGYYFGSNETHRFMILRIARKFGGFAFAVNYRKAPQYPFPCAIQDCLAAYLYLTRPPPGAKHAPVPPESIVFGGDSAGGGLALAVLQVLRDLELPLPAGAVLLSPWCDLTHSFPSILQNTKTDYIPPYSFIHKPSAMWPLPTDTGVFAHSWCMFGKRRSRSVPPPAACKQEEVVNVTDPTGKSIPVTSQVQMYATNAQLFHPLCSPALSGSLGGLPPLFVLAGDAEVLRDEAIYIAHKAAHPDRFPLRDELMDRYPSMRKMQAKYYHQPTKVHLQVYDAQCHVFPMFLLTTPAKYAFRALTSFIKYVTGAPCMEVPQASGAQKEWQYSGTDGDAFFQPNEESVYSGKVPLHRHAFDGNMIRERVDYTGKVRPMEAPETMQALRMPFGRVGMVNYDTYHRFQEGHTIWDNRYQHSTKRAQKKRAKYERRFARFLEKAQDEGLLDDMGDLDISASGTHWTDLAAFGPTDLHNEAPPPSSVVRRRDTPESLSMLKLALYQRAQRRKSLGLAGNAPPHKDEALHLRRSASFCSTWSGATIGENEPRMRGTGEHRPTDDTGKPLSKRFGLWKCTYLYG
ncbi:hypothetical protein MVES1_003826 [Malassezia vespertilionis]|uniref:uncharacterized protein n=1 Tax=Malassezia vespertilionis TaxID=2020962 RepID=UPI0024B1DF2F|nr:uncharacterized protein MVES1_003826 [Malassezia vespertilionis]WFD08450.1 hypothetical protein MVES1_003826 [Malassezia vespertilionis]